MLLMGDNSYFVPHDPSHSMTTDVMLPLEINSLHMQTMIHSFRNSEFAIRSLEFRFEANNIGGARRLSVSLAAIRY